MPTPAFHELLAPQSLEFAKAQLRGTSPAPYDQHLQMAAQTLAVISRNLVSKSGEPTTHLQLFDRPAIAKITFESSPPLPDSNLGIVIDQHSGDFMGTIFSLNLPTMASWGQTVVEPGAASNIIYTPVQLLLVASELELAAPLSATRYNRLQNRIRYTQHISTVLENQEIARSARTGTSYL